MIAALAGVALVSVSAQAQDAAAPPADRAMEQAMEQARRLPDSAGDGPWPAVIETDPSLPGFIIYRPDRVDAMRPGTLGVFIWGNGACADDGTSSRQHLAEIASYGYLVIAPGKWRSGPNAKDPPAAALAPPDASGRLSRPPTSSADLTAALDWALQENGREGSKYRARIDTKALGVGGFSCGGLQALEIAADPRWSTVVVQNSGIFNPGSISIAGMSQDKGLLDRLHTSVLYLLGGETDIAYPNGTDDFARIDHVPAIMVNIPTGHGGTYHQPMGGKAAGIVVDWLQWQLRNDRGADRSFVGANCRLCTDAEATIERRNLD